MIQRPRAHVFEHPKQPHLHAISPPFGPLFHKSENAHSEHFWNRVPSISYVNEQKWRKFPNRQKWQNMKNTCSRAREKVLLFRAHKHFHVLSDSIDRELSDSLAPLPALYSWCTGHKMMRPIRHVREHVCACWNTCARVCLRVFREVFRTPVFPVFSEMIIFSDHAKCSCS